MFNPATTAESTTRRSTKKIISLSLRRYGDVAEMLLLIHCNYLAFSFVSIFDWCCVAISPSSSRISVPVVSSGYYVIKNNFIMITRTRVRSQAQHTASLNVCMHFQCWNSASHSTLPEKHTHTHAQAEDICENSPRFVGYIRGESHRESANERWKCRSCQNAVFFFTKFTKNNTFLSPPGWEGEEEGDEWKQTVK